MNAAKHGTASASKTVTVTRNGREATQRRMSAYSPVSDQPMIVKDWSRSCEMQEITLL